jgi:hypothetical protein
MLRWLDPLGPFKWPSLLLVAAPLVAYPFWLPPRPRPGPATLSCSKAALFIPYRSAGSREVVLRPTRSAQPNALPVEVAGPVGFDNGGMVIREEQLRGAQLRCE